MSELKVLHAENQSLAAEGLKQVLSENQIAKKIYRVNKSEHIESGIIAYEPNLCVIDYSETGQFSISDLENIIKKYPQINILVISDDSSIVRVKKVLGLGVHGFLTRSSDTNEIILAITKISEGEKYFCSKIIDILVNESDRHDVLSKIDGNLTQREQQIVKYIALGKTNKQIAYLLRISHHTVHTHRKNAMKKLAVNTTTELVLYAIYNDIIELTY
tara:strand:+ start:513 stop:1163 length:651 start_codon:yes stop_codon:yes gene_type:complete